MPLPGGMAGAADFFSGRSVTSASVVTIIAAMLASLASAECDQASGSMFTRR